MTERKDLKPGPIQEQAIFFPPSGRLKIVAGAGSGKTEVLTRRISQLLTGGVTPERLVAITYTNKAAAAMKQRLIEKRKVPFRVLQKMELATFHAFLVRQIKEDPFGAKLSPGFRIVIQNERDLFLVRIMAGFRELFAAPLRKEFSSGAGLEKILEEFPAILQEVRRYLLSPGEFARRVFKIWRRQQYSPSQFERAVVTWFFRFFSLYIQELRRSNLLDFDEILVRSRMLLQEYRENETPLIRDVFLIDEFQDNNLEQLEIIQLFLHDQNSHLTVVGDPWQSIYRFQGAEVETFNSFKADRTLELQENFRSFQEILTLADRLGNVGEATSRSLTAFYGSSPRPNPVVCFLSENNQGRQEALVICETIKTLVKQGMKLVREDRAVQYGDFAIILSSIRKRFIVKVLEDELASRGIPYVLSGGLGFYDMNEIQELLAFFRLLENPKHDHALMKIMSGSIFGLSDSVLAKLAITGRSEKVHFLRHILALPEDQLPEKAVKFRNFFLRFQSLGSRVSLLDLVYFLLDEGGYREFAASRKSSLKRRRLEGNFAKFIAIVREFQVNAIFSSFRDFLVYVDDVLNSSIEESAAELGLTDRAAVKIMTIHKAKGLEFPVVFLPFLKKKEFRKSGLFRFSRSSGLLIMSDERGKRIETAQSVKFNDNEKIAHDAEERRKYYVALTRAQEILVLSGSLAWPSGNPLLEEIVEHISSPPHPGKVTPISDWEKVAEEWLKHGVAVPETGDPAEYSKPDPESLISSISSLVNLSPVERKVTESSRTGEIYSQNDLRTFYQCPRKYFFVTRFLEPSGGKKENENLRLGNLVHHGIRLFHEFGGVKATSIGKEKIIARILPQLVALCDYEEDSALKAQKILSLYSRHEIGKTEADRFEAEVHLRFDDLEEPFYLRGFADRVDLSSSGVTIYDFKTHRFFPKSHEEYAFQMALYLSAAMQGVLGTIGKLNFPEVRIVYLSENKITVKASEPNLEEWRKWVVERVSAIRQETTWQPCRSDHCQNCDYAVICATS